MVTEEQERNAERVVTRIANDLELVLGAYEAESVPSEIVLVALLMALHGRAVAKAIPFENIYEALRNI
jgi:hypothetical protein